MELSKLTKSYKGKDYIHVITEEDKNVIAQIMKDHNMSEQLAIHKFARSCSWEEVE